MAERWVDEAKVREVRFGANEASAGRRGMEDLRAPSI